MKELKPDFIDKENGYKEWYDKRYDKELKILSRIEFDDGEIRIYNNDGTYYNG